MPDSQTVVHTIDRSNGEVLTTTISDYKGKPYAGIRSYYRDRTSGEPLPGKNGISVSPAEIPLLLESVLKLITVHADVQAVCREKMAAYLDGMLLSGR